MTDNILSIKELADGLKLNDKTTCHLVSQCEIFSLKINWSWRFERLYTYICTKLGDCKNVFFN